MYCCPLCFKSYDCITSLKTHCKVNHYTGIHSIFRCRQKLSTETQLSSITCSRTFTDIHNFFQHLSTHSININTAHGNYVENSMENNIYQRNSMEKITIDSLQSNGMKEITLDSSQLMPSASHATNKSDTLISQLQNLQRRLNKVQRYFVANLYSN